MNYNPIKISEKILKKRLSKPQKSNLYKKVYLKCHGQLSEEENLVAANFIIDNIISHLIPKEDLDQWNSDETIRKYGKKIGIVELNFSKLRKQFPYLSKIHPDRHKVSIDLSSFNLPKITKSNLPSYICNDWKGDLYISLSKTDSLITESLINSLIKLVNWRLKEEDEDKYNEIVLSRRMLNGGRTFLDKHFLNDKWNLGDLLEYDKSYFWEAVYNVLYGNSDTIFEKSEVEKRIIESKPDYNSLDI